MTSRLWIASLLVCGLLVAEDPTVVAVRTRVAGSSAARLGLDLGLGIVMVAYNFASSRYVVSVGSASEILEAMAVVDMQRDERIARIRNRALRAARRIVSRLNPFDLIKRAGERLGRSVDRIGASARSRNFYRISALFEDLGVVNVLGVPGASLALSTSGREVSRRRSLRYCVLFVVSWFVGARLLGWLIGRTHTLPILGTLIASVTGAIGTTFALLTDVTEPVGLIAVVLMTAAILRYARQVERQIQRAG